MSVNEKIEAEELRFIYKLIVAGWSDSDILNKYVSLKDSGEINFSLQIDEGFIKKKRREIETAAEVLKDSIKKIIEIFIPKQRDEHFAKIAEISAILLQSNLHTVTVVENLNETTHNSKTEYLHPPKYKIENEYNKPTHLSRMQLVELFRKNVEKACQQFSASFFYDCYVAHIKATIGYEMESQGGFWPVVERNPYEVIKEIKNIMEGRELKGTCPLCVAENQLPPFIKEAYSDIF